MSAVFVIGAHNTRFGSFVKRDKQTGAVEDLHSIYDLIVEAGKGALDDAGVNAREVDGVWLGSCSPSLLANQEHLAPLSMGVAPEALRFRPMTRVEDACATSSVALYNAIYAVESGRFRIALVIGVEKMNLLDTKGVTHALACSSYWPEEGARGMTFPGLFAEIAKAYRSRHGIDEALFRRMNATVAARCYANSVKNPLAHFGPGSVVERLNLFTADSILCLPDEKNPVVAEPLRLHDCSLVSDGAAALVIARREDARAMGRAKVEIAGIGHATETMSIASREALYEATGARVARERAFEEAGISTADLDLAEVHDCFTPNTFLLVEALGLSEPGRAGYDFLDGRYSPDDACPINLSGGLKGKGHPVGATGASMHALVYKQLVGEPIGMAPSSKEPVVGAIVNVGGSNVSNAVTVLRRVG
jgi:acetyl-CoA C-acetyltransferase